MEFAVKRGGIIILVSSCREGIGDEHFYKLLAAKDTDSTVDKTRKFGYHKVAKLTNLLKNTRIFAVTNLPPSIPKTIGPTPYRDVQVALTDATRITGSDSEILVVLDAGITVPQPEIA